MKRPTFLEGVAVALVASVGGSILFRALIPISTDTALRVALAVVALGYVLYLLRRSGERVGRVTTMLLWVMLAGLLWLADLPLSIFFIGHIGAIWLVRSLHFHSGVMAAVVDLALVVFAVAAGIWALTISASLLLALWTFFLAQALFVAIPANLSSRNAEHSPEEGDDGGFNQAYRAAESALRRLSSTS